MKRNPYIDMLRGVSILLVMLLHYSLTYRLHDSPLRAWVAVPTLRTIFYNGNYGVSIFFVISGFLITSNIVRRYGSLVAVDVSHFYRLRIFRLYPLVVLALAMIVVLGVAGLSNFSNKIDGSDPGTGFAFLAVFSVLTFWHNLLMASVGYFNYAMNIYWSLSVEEVFYLLYPLVLVVAKRRWQLIALAGLAIVVAPAYRFIHRDDELLYLYGNLACVDMLALGCVAAIVAARVAMPSVARGAVAVLASVGMGWIYMRGIGGNEAMGATYLGLFAATFLVAVSGLRMGHTSRRLTYPLAWLGAHSYELYLFHIVVLGVIVDIVPRAAMPVASKLPVFVLFVGVSVVLAWIMARFIGTPLNRWLRSRFAQDKSRVNEAPDVLPGG